jgi:hypothetical protein
MPVGFLFLVTATLILKQCTATDGSWTNSSRLARSGCPDKCGNASIPYPFGIVGAPAGCFLYALQIYCDDDQVPYLGQNKTLKVLGFNLSHGELLVQKHIASICGNETNYTAGTFQLGSRIFLRLLTPKTCSQRSGAPPLQ